jgi:hypothetical protein
VQVQRNRLAAHTTAPRRAPGGAGAILDEFPPHAALGERCPLIVPGSALPALDTKLPPQRARAFSLDSPLLRRLPTLLFAVLRETVPMKLSVRLPALGTALVAAFAAQAGGWTPAKTLEGPFAAASPPTAPLVAVNANGHAMYAWNATGAVRFAERLKGADWSASRAVPGGGNGAGPVALAIGDNEVAAIAYTTVATRYDPQHLKVSLRLPGGGYGPAVEPVPGAVAGDIRLGVACDGSVTLVWVNGTGVWASQLAGVPGVGACDGTPGPGPWSTAQLISNGHVGAALPELAHTASGAALATWQEGAAGNPSSVAAAWRPAGGAWQPAQTISGPTARPTWNPKPALDAAGNAAVGYLDGNSMVVVKRQATGAWSAPVVVSGTQTVNYPALAMSGAGDLLAAWLTIDPGTGVGAVWRSLAPAGTTWPGPTRVSARSDSADGPTAAFAPDGSVALVGWTDDATNTSRVAVYSAGTWVRQALGAGWWGSPVAVAAGGGVAAAGWPRPSSGNPNAAKLMGRTWQ